MGAVIGEFKGNPMLILSKDENDKYPFQFGLSKAKLILANLDAIKKFVQDTPAAPARSAEGNRTPSGQRDAPAGTRQADYSQERGGE